MYSHWQPRVAATNDKSESFNSVLREDYATQLTMDSCAWCATSSLTFIDMRDTHCTSLYKPS